MNSLLNAILVLALALSVGTVLVACGEDNGTDTDGDDYPDYDGIQAITYYYGDASVSPEYHRSYSIKVTTDSVRVVVDSYGDTLAIGEYGSTGAKFEGVLGSLKSNGIRSCSLGSNDGCTGGTSEAVSCSDGVNEVFSGEVYHCGGRNFGNLCGNIVAFSDDIENLIPNLNSLLQ